ncbi:hypothetical protein G9A89_016356 [Geosiphon pyriformis]|nr:hypothetical protein G9A89_016356 [Geosiphon pyriformis]
MSTLRAILYQAENEIPRHIVNTVSISLREKEREAVNGLKSKHQIKSPRRSPRKSPQKRVIANGLTVDSVKAENEFARASLPQLETFEDNPFNDEKETELKGKIKLSPRHRGKNIFGFVGGPKKNVFNKFLQKCKEAQKEDPVSDNETILSSSEGSQLLIREKENETQFIKKPIKRLTRVAAKTLKENRGLVNSFAEKGFPLSPTKYGDLQRTEQFEFFNKSDQANIISPTRCSPFSDKDKQNIEDPGQTFQSDDSDDNDDDDYDNSQDEGNVTPPRKIKRAKVAVYEEDQLGYEKYFSDLHSSPTSHNTLSNLPQLEDKDLIETLNNLPVKHQEELEILSKFQQAQFYQWYFELISGFNLLFYGFGSKRKLLENFARNILTDHPLLIVNGYFPSINLRTILKNIYHEVLNDNPRGSLEEQARFIHSYFSCSERAIQRLYILIHNIDGQQLRSERTYACLSILASSPNIHFIASMDNIHAGLLIDNVCATRFNWVKHDATTYQPYKLETSYENSFLMRGGAELNPQSIHHVLSSLSPRARGIFQLLIKNQITESEGFTSPVRPQDTGLEYGVLYNKCRNEFLVSSEVTFQAQLTEFRDHRIIRTCRNNDGTKTLYVPLNCSILKGIEEELI